MKYYVVTVHQSKPVCVKSETEEEAKNKAADEFFLRRRDIPSWRELWTRGHVDYTGTLDESNPEAAKLLESYKRTGDYFEVNPGFKMKSKDQVRALAELDGIVFKVVDGMEIWRTANSTWNPYQLPNYLDSYDAIVALIQKQCDRVKLYVKAECSVVDSTPAQLCEALLRATNKWKE